jgi:hypothetical protein
MLAKKVLDFKNSCKGNEIESRSMGEAKRWKQNGLPSKGPKKSLSKGVKNKLFVKYPRLPYILIGVGVLYLIFDLVKYYNR